MKTIKSTLSLSLLKLDGRQIIEVIHENGYVDDIYFSEHDGTSIEPIAQLIQQQVLPTGGDLGYSTAFTGTGDTRDQIWITYYDEDLDLSEFDGNHYEFEISQIGDPEDPDLEWALTLKNGRYTL
jgi:hypothetical protein